MMEERTNFEEMAKTLIIWKVNENAQKKLDNLLGKCYNKDVNKKERK